MKDNNQHNRHSYLIRLDSERFLKLKKMAQNQPMSDVVNRGIDTEWIFYCQLKKLSDKIPNFRNIDEIQSWRMNGFHDSPELLAKYVLPTTILKYMEELNSDRRAKQEMIDSLDTIQYLIKSIGTNINQLARHANSGGTVSKRELRDLTRSIINLKNSFDENFKKKVAK